jgi:threonine dehydratase
VLAFSSGNHAQGVAYAAALHGVQATIIMPADAPQAKIDNTRFYGAEVILYDRKGGEDRNVIGARLQEDRGLPLIKPFDNADVIAGQGTCGLEIAQQAREAGIERAEVLACCGGGGLSAGIALALEADAPQMRLRTVEPEGFDDTARSLAAGEICRNTGPEAGLCDAIVTPAPGQLTFPILNRLAGAGIVVSDDEVRAAMRAAYAHLKLVVEPGGAVALAAALYHGAELEGDTAIVTLSGGNVDPDLFADILRG